MYIVEHLKTFSVTFMALFPVVNPIGDAPIFLAMTRWYPESTRTVLARRIAIYGFALLAGSFLFGSVVLDFFGISIVVVRLAGGLVLAAAGWSLLNQKDDAKSQASQGNTETLEDAMEHAFYPLTLPITVGPGCISIAITLGARLRNQGGPFLERGFGSSLIAMFVISAMVFYCYSRADKLVRLLGKSGTTILVRLSAFILLAIGVQIFWTGLQQGIPQLLTNLPCK